MILWSVGKLIACMMAMGSKHTSFRQFDESDLSQSVPMEASTYKECFEKKKPHPRRYSSCPSKVRRSCDCLDLWEFDCLYDDYGVRTHFVPEIEESHLSQSVAMEASTRKERFERKKTSSAEVLILQ